MACATLKRSLDWDSINQRPNKRRRCNPFAGAQSVAGCSRIVQEPTASVFAESAACSKLTPEKMAQNIRDEIHRLHRSKQLTFSNATVAAVAASATSSSSSAAAAEMKMQDSDNSGSEMGPDSSPRRPETPPRRQQHTADKELFSFKQVQLICERMLKEREEYLREQYDNVLTTKLAEQYDAFVKFTYDQIQRRYEAAPSYLS